MDGMVNYGILQPGIGNALAAGYQQAQDRQNALMQQQQQAEMNKMRLESGRMDLDRLQQERQTMLDFQSQLKSMGKDPDLGKMFDVMVQSGIPEQVRLGLEGKQKLTEQQRFAKIMGYEEGTPTTPAAPPTPSAAPATNALTAPAAAVPAAPNTMVTPVAAQFGPEQVAAVTNRIQGLLQLGTPQALQAARVLQDQLEMASRQRNTDQWLAVGNNVFNRQTGQFVKNPYATSGGAGEVVQPVSQDAVDFAARIYMETGKIPAIGSGKGASEMRQKILQRAAELSGGGAEGARAVVQSAQTTAGETQAVKAFNTGKQGDSVRSFNTGIDHLDTLNKATSALQNGDIKAFNIVGNMIAKQTGNPAPTDFNMVKSIVGSEVAKAITGSNMALADRDEIRKLLDASNSPAQLNSAIKRAQELMGGQLKSLRVQYESSTNRSDFDKKLTGRTKEVIGESEVPSGRKPAQAAPAVSADEKAQALSWAKANRSDPRAAKILQMYGEK